MTSSALLGPVLLAVTAETPSPPPVPDDMTIYTVTPGIAGFVTFFVLAVIGWLLFRSLVKHIRRVDHAELRRESTAAEGTEPPAEAVGQSPAEPGEGPAGR
ncbi:MAG TPA: hypothetical protein VKZ83_04285 [Phototrophicaceae bacterium]|nr:hypothetical protein [Phototrophicaceae bacterium]